MASREKRIGAGLALAGLIVALFIPGAPLLGGSGLCVQSVVDLTPQVVICGNQPTQVSGMQFNTVWLSQTPTQVTTVTSGTDPITVWIIPAQGTTVSNPSLTYCIESYPNGSGCTPNTSVSVGNLQSSPSGAYTFTAHLGMANPNTLYVFAASVQDSTGAVAKASFYMAVVSASYSLTFDVSSAPLTGVPSAPVAGAEVQLYDATNSGTPYSTQTTASNGATTFNVPFGSGSYFAVVSAANYAQDTTNPIAVSTTPQTIAVSILSLTSISSIQSSFTSYVSSISSSLSSSLANECSVGVSSGATVTCTVTRTTSGGTSNPPGVTLTNTQVGGGIAFVVGVFLMVKGKGRLV